LRKETIPGGSAWGRFTGRPWAAGAAWGTRIGSRVGPWHKTTPKAATWALQGQGASAHLLVSKETRTAWTSGSRSC